MNTIAIIGRLVRDPALKQTADGTYFSSFDVAVNNPFKKDETDFFHCVAWRQTAQNVAKWLKKASKVGIVGELHFSVYTGKDGVKRQTATLTAQEVEFLEKAEEEPDVNTKTATKKRELEPIDDDGLPF